MGITLVLNSLANGKIISPATTMLSLFARSIVFPVLAAIRVVSRPENPDIAEIITSTKGSFNKL